jgi:hypothetical protein
VSTTSRRPAGSALARARHFGIRSCAHGTAVSWRTSE